MNLGTMYCCEVTNPFMKRWQGNDQRESLVIARFLQYKIL
jgi:hypothetical protein